MAANLFEDIFAQGRLLIVVIFLLTIVVLGVIWGNRQMQRKSLLSKKGPVSPAGFNAPKELKKEIEESFNRISEMRLEPKLLSGDGDNEPTYSTFVDRKDDTSYKYRRKAFDLMSCLDELLCRVSICLARKHSQTVREHLNVLQFPPYAPFEDLGDLCEKVTSLYEQARYGAKEFGEDEFVLYSNGIDQLYDRVHQKFLVPGSLLVNSEHHQKMKDSECHENFDQDSLIEPSVSTESDNLFGIRNREGIKAVVA